MRTRAFHFMLAANNHSSLTRVTAECANRLIRLGHTVVVSVPYFSYWDFALWQLTRQEDAARTPAGQARRWLAWLIYPLIKERALRRPWYGATAHRLDPRVRVNRFWALPWAGNMPDADAIIVLQGYLLPHLLSLPRSKGVLVGSIRGDYLAGSKESPWWRHFTSFEPRVKIPYFAVSRGAAASARALGIDVETVIPNGVNTEEFQDGGRRGDTDPVRITLFCAEGQQKGQRFGADVIRRLQRDAQGSRLAGRRAAWCSIGRVLAGHAGLFDVNYGYLTGDAYARAYQETDIFVYPSLNDGFPAPPLEAMACGCAVAATRVSGLDDYGVHLENCLLAAPNDVEGMAEHVLQLVQDVGLRDALRVQGVATAARYSWDETASALAEFVGASIDDAGGERVEQAAAAAG